MWVRLRYICGLLSFRLDVKLYKYESNHNCCVTVCHAISTKKIRPNERVADHDRVKGLLEMFSSSVALEEVYVVQDVLMKLFLTHLEGGRRRNECIGQLFEKTAVSFFYYPL